jgi:hypothetical protein
MGERKGKATTKREIKMFTAGCIFRGVEGIKTMRIRGVFLLFAH